ncbi:hypothetical protein C471_03015 [Halorubrum saccharovorum DSM 1137]|uniref:DUF5518 domain-containing protein n=1 Tax=Halorubrum saccharovorum DSM 1137 TaxID=1227484 RepID=M0E950_9EURY|nr:hypothetical protein C471_03015 [Halorubrum saccharovorum DSM 1137]
MSVPGNRRVVNTDNSLLNAAIGAVATIGLSFTGISPVLGGALAAYLEGGETGDGLRVGALSGLIASLPLAAIVVFALAVFSFGGDLGVAIGGGLLVLAIVAIAVGYTVALSALGGVLGAYLKDEL